MGRIIAATIGKLINSRTVSSTVIGTAILLVAGTIGVASSSPVQYSGCENPATGAIRLLTNTNLPAPWNYCLDANNPSPLAAALLQKQPQLAEVAIEWNQQGPPGANGANGANGLSVVNMPVPVGDATCPTGGSKFAVGTVTTYACNGKDGANGKDGVSGTNGTNGKDGTSVIATTLPPNDPNCPSGGSSFSVGTATTYACNGTNGLNGADGNSVISSVVAAGDVNCPNGGSKFTAGSSVTYACNGASPKQILIDYNMTTVFLTASTTTYTTLASVSPQPGTYLATAKLNIGNTLGSQEADCRIFGASGATGKDPNQLQVIDWVQFVATPFSPGFDQTLNLEAPVDVTGSPATVQLVCHPYSGTYGIYAATATLALTPIN